MRVIVLEMKERKLKIKIPGEKPKVFWTPYTRVDVEESAYGKIED